MSKSVADITDYCRTVIARELKTEPGQIDTNKLFGELGLDSIHALYLMEELDAFLGFEVAPTVFWDYPTVDSLANHLANATPPKV